MIKNLMFDLGGVIMNIRRENCVEAFKELGMTDADKFLGEYAQAGAFGDIESGKCTAGEFRDEIRRMVGKSLTDEQIDKAFGKFLLGIPRYRLEELHRLSKRFNLYLLSNTNPIMWHREIADSFAQEGHDVNYYFKGVVRSYEAKVMKPEAEIFHIAERRFGIKPDETIFLDDSKANCEAAERLGFKTIHVAPGTEFYQLLCRYPGLDLKDC